MKLLDKIEKRNNLSDGCSEDKEEDKQEECDDGDADR